ncbi:MAG: ankyrin repeat domain-containing protein, partial [Akkermansia sp.]|nr:ankyrin repeat domain-containing protein [Akkermansia sp.]
MKLSHKLTAFGAAFSCAPLLLAQQAAPPTTTPLPDAEEAEAAIPAPPQPDESAIAALEQAGIQRKNFNSTLVAAAYSGNDVTMQTLLAAGADVNARDYRTRGTALHAAAQEGHIACIQVLIGH